MSRWHPMNPEERKAAKRVQQQKATLRRNAINNHVHAHISIREIRKASEEVDILTDPVRGLNRGYFNIGDGCRQIPRKKAAL